MKKFFVILLCFLLLCGCSAAPPVSGSAPVETGPAPEHSVPPEPEPTPTPSPEPPQPTVATLAVCGDAMSHNPVRRDAWLEEEGRFDYGRIMGGARAAVSAADYAVVNLETPLAGGPNYSGYPMFNAPDDLARDLKEMGFNLCLTANNHCLDKGFAGLSRTLDALDEAGLAHVGTSRTQEERDNNTYVADVGGISVAFLGFTYGTNGLPVPSAHPYAVNVYNTDYLTNLANPDWDMLAAEMDKAEALEADLIAVMIHWGLEYFTTQNHYQEQVADFLFDHGADIILGGHSHVPQPMELRTLEDGRRGFVCYSLGNFFSSQNSIYTDTTAVLTLELTKDPETGEAQVTGYGYDPMLMLDREEGAYPRFELLDAQATLDAGVEDAWLEGKLKQCIEDCRTIFGEAPGVGVLCAE